MLLPAKLRNKIGIVKGSKVFVTASEEYLVIKPLNENVVKLKITINSKSLLPKLFCILENCKAEILSMELFRTDSGFVLNTACVVANSSDINTIARKLEEQPGTEVDMLTKGDKCGKKETNKE